MKKFIALLLATTSLFLLCACASGADKGDETTAAEETTETAENPEGFDGVTTPAEDTDDSAAEDTTAEETTAAPANIINDAEEAIATAKAWLGESDPDTGYMYAYSYDGFMMVDDFPHFKIRVSWYIEEQERYSLCGYLLVSPEGEVTKYSW